MIKYIHNYNNIDMNYKIFSLIHYDNNKLYYNDEKYDLKYILNNIKDTICLVLDNNIYSSEFFMNNKKYYRYFVDEKYNFEKTSYICWCESNKNNNTYIPYDKIQLKLLSNLSPETKYIKLNENYNQTIDMLVDTNITHIIFGNRFNQKIDNLSWIIEYLYFGLEFNQPLDNLPGSVKKLMFSTNSNFNQLLDCLPSCLEYLLLPTKYNHPIDNLPNLLKYLELYCEYPNPLNNLPRSLEKFIFYPTHQLNFQQTSRTTNSKLNIFKIPNIIYNSKIDKNHTLKVFVSLPQNLKYLDLTYSYKLNIISKYINDNFNDKNCHIKKEIIKNSQILDNLPTNLKVLKYPSNYNLILVENIPQNIVKLFLSNKFNKSVDKLLNPNFGTSKPRPPTKITHLIFGDEFNQSVNYLPPSLTHIFFGSSFDKSIDNLPNSIQVLVLGTSFNKSINNLPINLIDITFGEEFNQPVNGIKLQVQKIKFTRYNNLVKYSNTIYSTDGETKKEYFKFNYDKKIAKIPPNAKILLPNVIGDNKYNFRYFNIESNEEFYPMFDEYIKKGIVEYY